MGYEISSVIQVGTTISEWAEIKAAFAHKDIDWPACVDGLDFYDRELRFSNKNSSPWYDGDMSKLSRVYPTALFYYLAQGEDEHRPSATWFVNGKEGEKKAAMIELEKAYQDAVSRAVLGNGRVAEGVAHRVELMPDGRVAADGENRFGECNVLFWKNIKQISCGNWHTVGLTSGGELIACGSNENGQCDFSQITDTAIQISCGRYHTALLLASGRVVVCGHLEQQATMPQGRKKEAQNIDQIKYTQTKHKDWTKIKKIISIYDAVAGLTEDNRLLIDGFCPCEENELRAMFGLSPLHVDLAAMDEMKPSDRDTQIAVSPDQTFSYRTIDSIPESFFEGVMVTDKNGKLMLNKPKKKVMEFDYDGNQLRITVGLAAKLNSIWKRYGKFITGEASGEDEYDELGTLYDPIDAAEISETEMRDKGRVDSASFGYTVPRDTKILTDDQIRTRALLFLKLCILCSEERVAKYIVEAAPKKKNGTFAKNRITHIATLFCATNYYGTTELVGVASDETEIQITIRAANLNFSSIEAVYNDLASTTNLFRIICTEMASEKPEKTLETVPTAPPETLLYPHYSQLSDVSNPSGNLITANKGGAEFESYPLSLVGGELKEVATRICSQDVCSNEFKLLVTTASSYVALFHVDEAAFNPHEDREGDILNLRMRYAYQLHTLRSFAWTLAEKAALQQKAISDLQIYDYQEIFTFIEQRKHLNYCANSHFPALCGFPDLHVSFVPDRTDRTDKNLLSMDGESFGHLIPNSVASLDGLRNDLIALAGPMEKVFQWLLGGRDYSKPLIGTAADALYAWCTMVLSARTPFFIKNGPKTCFYSQDKGQVKSVAPLPRELDTSSTTQITGNSLKEGENRTDTQESAMKGDRPEGIVSASTENKKDVEAKQKSIKNEDELKQIAATLQKNLAALYRDTLDGKQYELLKREISSVISDCCDKQTWGEIARSKIPVILAANLCETSKNIMSTSPEEAYDLLPEWITKEYIQSAEDKRLRLSFEQMLRELEQLSKESVRSSFEKGLEKNEILGQFISSAKEILGDGLLFSAGLTKFNSNPILEMLRLTLGCKPFDSLEPIIDIIIQKKSSEYDKLASLLRKKESEIEAIVQEKAKLEEERSHLGWFHGKRKKEIAALLEMIPDRIKKVEEDYENAKNEIYN